MARFVELAAKYGFTDDGQSIDGWGEDAGREGDPSEERDRAVVSYGKTEKEQLAVRGRRPAVQKIKKVAPTNQLSSIEVQENMLRTSCCAH